MDFEEMQRRIRELENEIRNMRDVPDEEFKAALQNALVVRTQPNDQYIATTNISHGSQASIDKDVNHMKQADVMLQIEYGGKQFFIPAYRKKI